jgi:hypothetical protein
MRRCGLLLGLLLLGVDTLALHSPSASFPDAAHVPRHALFPRRMASDLVFVVTWHQADLAWLAHLPLSPGRLVVYVKGDQRKCADVPQVLVPALAACVQTENAVGRDGHTISLFLTSAYHHLPKIAVFVQDDGTAFTHLLTDLGKLTQPELAAWLAQAVAEPYTSRATCLCDPIVEHNWRACSAPGQPCWQVRRLQPGVTEEAELPHEAKWQQPDGLWYDGMAWLLGDLAQLPVQRWDVLRWAGGAQLAVRGVDVRRHPRALYRRLQQLLGARNASAPPPWFVPERLRGLNGKEWGHIVERC